MDVDAKRYMTEIVDPTISEFEANPCSQRHGVLACVVTFHAIDYLTYPKKSANSRKDFRDESPEFALVDRVAHAFKHVALKRVITGHQAAGDVIPLKADDVIVRPPGFCDVGVYDLSRLDDSVGGITIKGEHEHDLLVVVKRAAEYLRNKIHEKTV
jgi:hypothetical protein